MRVAISALLAVMMLPMPALATHMGQYTQVPTSHDAQGTILEPDFASTSVLGPLLHNCVVDLPADGTFHGDCGDDAARTGPGDVVAPGCTGADARGAPVRRQTGQCGLWTVGIRAGAVTVSVPGTNPVPSLPVVPAGTVAPPLSERGMGAGQGPGRYAGTVRFLDGVVDQDATQNPLTGGPTNLVGLNRHLREAGVGNWVLPGDNMLWAWMGDWTDLNGNGVVDACHATCSAAMANEFVWRGNCMRFGNGGFSYYAVEQGFCAEDLNPNVEGSHTCVRPEFGPCANASMVFWQFPGNHNPGVSSDMPGNQVLTWSNNFNCQGPPTCDEVDRDRYGDPLLGAQDEVTPDGLGMEDRTGDNGLDDAGDDSARQYAGSLGNVGTYYGDDGLLVTAVYVYGYNCAPSPSLPQRYNLVRPAGTAGGCRFLDVDVYPTVSPSIEALLVGNPEQPTGGIKGTARAAWLLLLACACGGPPSDPLTLVESIVGSREVYEATLGPEQGHVDDVALNPGFSREPNSPPRTYRDAAGVVHTVADSYPGATYASCEEAPVGDARNPTEGLDLISLESQHRGFCNVGPEGLGSAYRLFESQRRGWLDVQPIRHLIMGTPIGLNGVCTYCFFGVPFVGLNVYPEPSSVPNAAEDHGRTLGAGNYFFGGPVGSWRDEPFMHDESVFPAFPNTHFVTYPADHWVGTVARAGGQWQYRNFTALLCTTEKDGPFQSSLHEAAECNPFLDGNAQDPQDYIPLNQGGEFDGKDALLCAGTPFSFAPVDGDLGTQVIVWRDYAGGIGPLLPNVGQNLPRIETYGPGRVDPLSMRVFCPNGTFFTTDLLTWPTGNLGDDIVTWVTHEIPLGFGGQKDIITDVDFYAAIHAMPEV